MTRLITKWILYFALLVSFSYMFGGEAAIGKMLLMAAVFAVLNIILRPIISVIAGGLGIVSFGIPILFINLPTLYLADAISGNALSFNFWTMFLLSILMFIADFLHIKIFKNYRPMGAR